MKPICRLSAILVSALMFIACSGQTASLSQPSHDPTIKPYKAMLSADEQKLLSSESNHCLTIDDTGCPAAAAVVIAALQPWLDDLNRSQPPASFGYLDVQIRRHLALAISDVNATVAGYRAKDQNGMNTALSAAISELDTFESEVGDIISSSQATIATYIAAVRLDKANLLACDFCQRLVSQSQVNCAASQTPSCVDEIAATRLQVEAFQGDLVRLVAPDSLATKDGRLQADLFTADVSLGAMASAVSAGDQVALQAGHNSLLQALGRADLDAADIVKSS